MAIVKRENSQGFSASDAASNSMTNTATETVLFTIPIPPNAMGTSKQLNFTLYCVLTSTVVNPTLTIRVKFGAATLTVVAAAGIAVSITNKPFIIEGMIAAQGTTANQIAFAKVTQSGSTVPLLAFNNASDFAEWTIDTTTSQTFGVTAQFGTALTGTTLTFKHSSIELK